MRLLPSVGKMFTRLRNGRAGSNVHSSRGTQPEPLPFPAAAFLPPKREEPEAVTAEVRKVLSLRSSSAAVHIEINVHLLSIQLLAQDKLQLTATGLVFRMKVSVCVKLVCSSCVCYCVHVYSHAVCACVSACVGVCTCTCVYVHACVRPCVCACLRACLRACMCAWVHTCVHACAYIYMSVCMCSCVRAYVIVVRRAPVRAYKCVCSCVRAYMRAYVFLHASVYVCLIV